MNKLKEDLRVGVLGAAAGLFTISIVLLIARIYTYYAWLHDSGYKETYRGVEDLEWIPVAIWHLILSVAASLLAHRYLKTGRRSPFLLWQVIGFASLLGWVLSILGFVSLQCLVRGDLYAVQHLFNSDVIATFTRYFSVGFACNVFYGSVIQAGLRQYTPQFDELASER